MVGTENDCHGKRYYDFVQLRYTSWVKDSRHTYKERGGRLQDLVVDIDPTTSFFSSSLLRVFRQEFQRNVVGLGDRDEKVVCRSSLWKGVGVGADSEADVSAEIGSRFNIDAGGASGVGARSRVVGVDDLN